MRELPHGTVTFLFTDIAGSADRWERDAPRLARQIARRDRVLIAAAEEYGGIPFKQISDAFQVVFDSAPAAVAAAVAAQHTLVKAELPDVPVHVRMALHSGAAEPQGGDYLAPWLHRLGQLLAAGHGGQILLSHATYVLAKDNLPAGSSMRALGEHQLRDLREPERIWQMVVLDLPSDFPHLHTLADRPNNLPLQPNAFIGREAELAQSVGLLRKPDLKLLTLTGPGGVGKTRLALQVAAELSEDFDDGICFVDLAPVREPELVMAAIAQALEVRESGSAPTETQVIESIGQRALLLVLDNFEHVTAVAPAVLRLLVCRNLKLLVTSRTSLGVRAGQELPVAPMPVPPVASTTPTSVSDSPSVRIFVDRASAVSPDFALTAENAAVVAEICRRLDGLPLAIELAAARIRIFPPDALLARLERRLPLLTGGAADAPERQRTLRDTIRWSFDLLDQSQQALFAQLSVFSGGGTMAAIEALTSDTTAAAGDSGILIDALDGLVKHSLVRQTAPAGEPRFTMLQTMREFGAEQLQKLDLTDKLSQRHAEIYRDLAERVEPFLLAGNDEARWLRVLDPEQDNFRAALGWSLVQDPATAARLAGALNRFWTSRGHLTEGADWLSRALAVAPHDDPRLAGKLLHGGGRIAWFQGEYARSVALQERSLDLWRTFGDLTQVAWMENALADAAVGAGDEPRAISLYQDALEHFRSQNVEQGVAIVLIALGYIAQGHEDWERTVALYDEALAISRRLGDMNSISVLLGNLGEIALEQGRVDEANSRYQESLRLAWELDDVLTALQGLVGLGRAAVASGDFERGARLLAAARAQSESIDAPLQPGEREGFDMAVKKAMSALGETKGGEIWASAKATDFEVMVQAELSADQGGSMLTPGSQTSR